MELIARGSFVSERYGASPLAKGRAVASRRSGKLLVLRKAARWALIAVAQLALWLAPVESRAGSQGVEPLAELRWRNGDVTPGELRQSNAGQIRWRSPVFLDELVVAIKHLDAILFSGQPVPSDGAFRVSTTSGDMFTADLVGADEDTYVFLSQRYGRVPIPRDAVYSLQGRLHPDLLFDGSQLSRWGAIPDAPIQDLSYQVYREDQGWNRGGFPDLSRLRPVDVGRLDIGYLDLSAADVEGRFGMVFEGRIAIKQEGDYRFDLWADDKARLSINGRLVVEFPEQGRYPEEEGNSGLVHLEVGLHTLRVEYLELGGGPGLSVRFSGPDGKQQSLVGTNQSSGWKRAPGGHPHTARERLALLHELELPRRFEMDIELVSSESPRFVLALGKDRRSAESMQSLRLETWGDELVIVQDKVFEPLMTIGEAQREIRLRLVFDGDTGEVELFDANGRSWVTLNGVQATTGDSGIYIRNRGQDLTVRRLRVYRQSAEIAPLPMDSSRRRVHLFDGRVLYGRLMVDERGAFVRNQDGVRQDMDLRLVDRIAAPNVSLIPAATLAELGYQDGGIIRGRIESTDSDRVILRTAFSETPVTCLLAGAVWLRFDASATQTLTPGPPGDQLFFAPGHMRGELKFNLPGWPLAWKVEGVDVPLRLLTLTAAWIERDERHVVSEAVVNTNQFPHILHLKTGEVMPCRVVSYNQESLGIRSPFADGRELPSTYLKAIELIPGWKDSESDQHAWWADQPPIADTAKHPNAAVRLGRALTVPRFNRHSPPSHIVVSKTGDLKRGTLLGIEGETLQFESKLRTVSIPMERLSCIVDVSNPEASGTEMPVESGKSAAASTVDLSAQQGAIQVGLADDSVLLFTPKNLVDGRLFGHSPIYGRTAVPTDRIETLMFGEVGSGRVSSAFSEWVVRPAAEPWSDE